jgi:hypothetical protein
VVPYVELIMLPVQEGVVVRGNPHPRRRAAGLSIRQVPRDAQGCEVIVRVARFRKHAGVVGPLGPGHAHPPHEELVPLGLAAENRMVVDDQRSARRMMPPKVVRSREARETSAHNDQIVELPVVDGVGGR